MPASAALCADFRCTTTTTCSDGRRFSATSLKRSPCFGLHHREKTSGLRTPAAVATANAAPFNRRQGVSRPYNLHFEGQACEIDVGGNRFGMTVTNGDGALVPVSIDGVPLVGFILQDGHLLLNLALFDEFNQLVLHIKNNQLLYSVAPWDIQFVGRNLVVREAARKILIDIEFNVPAAIRIRRARLMRTGSSWMFGQTVRCS